ncbi:SDR family oxidoreductase [Paenibacillus sp. NFR01]|uniref:SDR family oxidoreductase n=1 Tax=Paenibacillus sp. NFR01 TaxID=1566279 RepID=UPI0008C836E9|nr:SDR family oxidoreductase [Paenibacillus sp. NFR01]SET13438.1 NADP-dependent 3-hydroxy acid dehydrogenase YdfG [Paenibacillus sp. NFR01]
MTNKRLTHQVALITGASSGFGLLTALALAARGSKVIATMRDVQRGGELLEQAAREGVSEQIEILQMDVTDGDSIRSAVAGALARYGGIDILVNNAGIAVGGYAEDVSMEAWRRQMETNFFGLVAVTREVLPGMRSRRSGTVINVSSVSGLSGFPGYAPYAASKFAVEGFSESLRHEMLPFGVHVVLVEPASFRTPIWDKGFAGIERGENSAYAEKLEQVLAYSRRSAAGAPHPRKVAELIAKIAASRSPKLRYPVGRGARLLPAAKLLVPWKWLERIIASALARGSNEN